MSHQDDVIESTVLVPFAINEISQTTTEFLDTAETENVRAMIKWKPDGFVGTITIFLPPMRLTTEQYAPDKLSHIF